MRLKAENAKTGEARTLMLVGDLAELIDRRWHARLFTRITSKVFVSDYVFHRTGQPIEDFRGHVAMKISGHKTESMYQRYNIVSESDLRAAAEKTQLYLDTLPSERLSTS